MVSFTEKARRLLGEKCEICSYDKFVLVHFIVPKKDGGLETLSNAIVLCPNHHKEAQHGLISKDELYSRAGFRGSLSKFLQPDKS